MINQFQKTAESVGRMIRLAIGRAVLSAVSDEGKRQLIQLQALKGETKEGIQRVQNYGFTSVPLEGAEVIFVCVGGNRDHPIAISVDDPRHRKAGLVSGEVAIYTDEGDYILLKRGRVVEISTETLLVKASAKARFETPQLEVTGNIIDRVDDDGRSMSNMREVYDDHTHPETNSGDTQEPNQKMGGGA